MSPSTLGVATMTPFGRLSVWLALLAVSVLLPGQASANPPPENLVPVDQNGYFVNEHTDLFTKTGARVAKYKDANKCVFPQTSGFLFSPSPLYSQPSAKPRFRPQPHSRASADNR